MFQQIIDENLTASGALSSSAIYSIQSGQCRAASSQDIPKETYFHQVLQKGGDLSTFSSGIIFDDVTYQPIKIDRNSTIGRNGQTNIIITSSLENLIVGLCGQGAEASRAIEAAETAANRLKEQGQ